jgi:hypothetical protein
MYYVYDFGKPTRVLIDVVGQIYPVEGEPEPERFSFPNFWVSIGEV